jgi:hypothetical protein
VGLQTLAAISLPGARPAYSRGKVMGLQTLAAMSLPGARPACQEPQWAYEEDYGKGNTSSNFP